MKLPPASRTLRHDLAAAMAAAICLAGCGTTAIYSDSARTTAPNTEAPISTNFRTNTQLKLQAGQHWASIAEDTGKAIAELLGKMPQSGPQFRSSKSIFVNPPVVVTEFSRAFHTQLITTLVSSGLVVSKDAGAAMSIDIDVQTIVFAPNRPQYRFAGKATELGPGVWALRDAATVKPEDAKLIPPVDELMRGNALHWFRTEFASGQTPQTEILVTVSAGNEKRYLARTTNVYYITDGDRKLYEQEICSRISTCPSPAKEKEKPPLITLEVTDNCGAEKCCPDGKPCPAPVAAEPAAKVKAMSAKKKK